LDDWRSPNDLEELKMIGRVQDDLELLATIMLLCTEPRRLMIGYYYVIVYRA